MHNKQARRAVSEITQALGDKSFQKLCPRAKKAYALIRSGGWEERIAPLFPVRERFCCTQIAALFSDLLAKISPVPEDGWIPYTFRYARTVMFPHYNPVAPVEPACADGARVLLKILQALFRIEARALPFDPFYCFAFPTAGEGAESDHLAEYERFLLYFREEFVYELLRLASEATPFSLLAHVAGVHHVAMTVARGLSKAGIPVDLPLLSAAAAGHDFGKLGCLPGERVPYLHYYYTDRWFTARALPATGHIAANHSTWDLELENLSAESLSLIYADFRVKQGQDANGRETTEIYSLDDSFNVILSKLDNVDASKRRRYEFVYEKLHDFEIYLRLSGINTGLSDQPPPQPAKKEVALMEPGEIVTALTMRSVEHNLGVMHRLNSPRKFGSILEAAHSEKSWQRLRAYLNIFDEYFTYLDSAQKIQMLSFLYELLMQPEGDIRRQAARLMGNIIARFSLGYRKEAPEGALPDPGEETPFSLWEKYLEMFIYPDHKITAQHKSRIGYALKLFVDSALAHCRPEDVPRFLKSFLSYFAEADLPEDTSFVLLDSMRYLPFELCGEDAYTRLAAFAGRHACLRQPKLTAAALRFLAKLAGTLPHGHPCRSQVRDIALGACCDGDITLLFLQYQILRKLGLDTGRLEQILFYQSKVSDIFLDNLKAATPWIMKAVNIEFLLEHLGRGTQQNVLHIATHFSNLIKVSEWVVVRQEAGAALLRVMPYLSLDQRNEIAVELTKSLEVSGYGFSKYIPDYLGEVALFLHPTELDELISRLRELLGNSNAWIASVTLETVGVMLRAYPAYPSRFPEGGKAYEDRRQRLGGLLLIGLANHQESVRQEALLVLGQTVFGSNLAAADKAALFSFFFKKLLFLIDENPGNRLTFFYRASALSHIYRFIALHRLENARFIFEARRKAAFFPGTFDPFTLSHKGIVRAIRDMGFEVFLAIDEFSWSKKTQPRLIRRQIVSMSVADEAHVHLFPDSIPINIANPDDLRQLKGLFDGYDLYVVVGSDVIKGASSYRAQPSPDSIHSMNHIVFDRTSGEEDTGTDMEGCLSRITGKCLQLQLPPHLEDISSTRIRENIDLNRDISNLIDPVVQEFIYRNGLYLREPQYKPVFSADDLALELVEHPCPPLLEELRLSALRGEPDAEAFCSGILESGDTLLLMRHQLGEGPIIGCIAFRETAAADLFHVLKRMDLAEYVRRSASGKLLLITGIYARHGGETAFQTLLTDVLAGAIANNCGYALFFPHGYGSLPSACAVLERQGFLRAPASEENKPLYVVDMRAPSVLVQNIATTVKMPFSSDPHVLSAISSAHTRLQNVLTQLYPGNLVLSLSAGVIHRRLVDKVTALNGVPSAQTVPRRLGPHMCVPFGKILRGQVVPNTVTKTLHTDKVYTPDISSFSIESFPYYSPIESQIRTIKSFRRQVMLVDDLIHDGDRIQAIEPLFRKNGIDIRMVFVGILSGRGRDRMTAQGIPLESVYFIPNLRCWFVESTFYPFIGGDTVRSPSMPVPGLLPSVNRILPYATPTFLSDCTPGSIFTLSKCCIENSRDILAALELVYQEHFARSLTLSRLPEAVNLPLCPDKGNCMAYDPNLPASVYLENDLAMLMRTRDMIR